MTERLQKLQKILEIDPKDTFVVYAIAMEYKKANQSQLAIEWFGKVIAIDPGYAVAYHQAGLTYEADVKIPDAIEMYQRGIAAADKKGDHHAADEMRAALAVIE